MNWDVKRNTGRQKRMGEIFPKIISPIVSNKISYLSSDCALNTRKIVHLLFMMSYEWKPYFNPNFQKITIIFK